MKKFLLFIMSLPFICIVLIFILFVGYGLCSYVEGWLGYRGSKFDQKVWFDDGHLSAFFEASPKCKMYSDLVKNHLKKGMHLDDVEKLLGKTDYISYCMDKKNKCHVYTLGICYIDSFGMSHGNLVICFDEKSKLVKSGKKYLDREFCDYRALYYGSDGNPRCYTKKDQFNEEKCPVKIDPW